MKWSIIGILGFTGLFLMGCTSANPLPKTNQIPSASPSLSASETLGSQETATVVPSVTSTPVLTLTSTPALTPTQTATLTSTSTPEITPTPRPSPGPMTGKIITVERLSCRFGPGVDYLFRYSHPLGAKITIVGRMEYSHWLYTGGKNPCWVSGVYVELSGKIEDLPTVDPHITLPWSPYYGPLTGVSATRAGSIVTVFWDPLELKPGDDSEQVPYLVEAWVCVNGQRIFAPTGSYTTAVQITDEPGCTEPSYARVFAAEKHGYTPWIVVPWPQP